MARGPRGERRPEDPAAAAVMAVRLAVGELTEELDESATSAHGRPHTPKNQAAVELGRLGGQRGGRARAEKLSAEQRREIAKRAAAARWNNDG